MAKGSVHQENLKVINMYDPKKSFKLLTGQKKSRQTQNYC